MAPVGFWRAGAAAAPINRRPVDADAVARIDYLTQSLKQLGHAQAKNDRENDREIPKLIYASYSALSIAKDFVDLASHLLFVRILLGSRRENSQR